MNFTKKGLFLIDHFKHDVCESDNQSLSHNGVVNTLSNIYTDLCEAYTYVEKSIDNPTIRFEEINTIHSIPFPKKFPISSFPTEIRSRINDTAQFKFTYTTKQLGRNITFHFVTERASSNDIDMYVIYAKNMIAWLYIVDQYASKKCAKDLVVYLYMTNLQKNVPQSNLHILDENNVNTAFTTTCPVESEIVIFRKEEWFKVFIHETFHNFALDFSDMNMESCNKKILSIFPVKSEVNLFESYTEFWANIMNICFVSFLTCNNNSNRREFIQHCIYYIDLESKFNVFQMVKALGFMGLTYNSLYKKTNHTKMLRDTLYKENTNVLAYYVIKTILLVNYRSFLTWCNRNNTSLIQFKKTTNNLSSYCEFISDHYKSPILLHMVDCEETHLSKLIKKRPRTMKKKKENNYLLRTMRMTICELS